MSRRFFFVTGKGGVGKTTVTAALALALSRSDKRVLITTCGAEERLSKLLAAPAFGTAIAPLAPNLWGVRLSSDVALREYGLLKLKSRAIVDAIFDSKTVSGFLSGTPGLREWALLGKAWYHSNELDDEGRPRFDVVLFDAPATGHGLDMLRVPKVIVDLAPPGVLRADAERALEMFRDPRQSGVVVVTLPEEMPTNETLELCAALTSELALPIAEIILNAWVAPLFDPAERASLAELRDLEPRTPGEQLLTCGVRRALRERVGDESLARLQGIGAPVRRLELLPAGATSPAAIARLAQHFAGSPLISG